jgi:hypothetical protein
MIKMMIYVAEERGLVEVSRKEEITEEKLERMVPVFSSKECGWLTVPGISAADVLEDWRSQYIEVSL